MRFSAATQTFLLELLCSSCRSGCTALTTAAVTTAVTARRFSSPITSTPDSVLGTLRRSGPGRATWASSAAPSSPTPTEVSVLADRFPSAHSVRYGDTNMASVFPKQRDMTLCSWSELWRRPWSWGEWGTIPSTSRPPSSAPTRASWSGRSRSKLLICVVFHK